MRLLITVVLAVVLLSSMSHRKISVPGSYYDHFGACIRLNPDSTFMYEWHFDLMGSWSRGTWKMNHDSLLLTVIPVYDTIEVYENHRTFDRLMLSGDSISSRKYYDTVEVNETDVLVVVGKMEFTNQNSRACPDKLILRKDRFYRICENSRPCRKKVKGFWTRKKYPTYFEKR